jgi:hypothetical protein
MFRPIWPSSGVSIRVFAPSAMQWSASASGFGRGIFMVFYAGFLCAWLRCFVVRPTMENLNQCNRMLKFNTTINSLKQVKLIYAFGENAFVFFVIFRAPHLS